MMTEVAEKRIIEMLEELIARQEEGLRIISETTGRPIKEITVEERRKYLEIIKKKLYH